MPKPQDYARLSDEELAAQCAAGIDAAERELLQRHMQAIYWLPRRAFGAPEEALSDFLLYATEKIRVRNILSKFDPDKGASFRTWFGVVLRRLYLDYLRATPDEPASIELTDQTGAETPAPPEKEYGVIAAMTLRCRVLFKLLLCNTYFLTPEEISWIAETNSRGVVETARQVAAMEERLCEKDAELQQRYDQLATACWWKQLYEKRLYRMEKGETGSEQRIIETSAKLQRRQQEYERLIHELAGTAGIATAPYRELAKILNMKEGTLASQISRCRAAAADYVRNNK